MIVPRRETRRLLGPEDFAPTDDRFEVVGAFNPGAVRTASGVVLLVRVAERPREQRPGFTGLPRWDPDHGLTIDWTPNDEVEPIDPRVVRRRADGLVRLTFISHLRVVFCGADGLSVQGPATAALRPGRLTEEFGVEDPRITAINGRYYISYVAVSRHGPATALASTEDFERFEYHGVIFCAENKDVVLFPEPTGGSFAALHRPVCGTPFTRPEMWAARSPDLFHWGDHRPLAVPGGEWRSGRVGAGAPPILVPDGWLELYHGNRQASRPGEVGAYYGAALLLDRDDPSRVIAQTPEPILQPEADFEREGFVPNVVFPTGLVRDGRSWLVYYGAADAATGVVRLDEENILSRLEPVAHR